MEKKTKALAAIILAAGGGTRMKSGRPKVLYTIGGRTLLERVLDTALAAGAKERLVVVGAHARKVAEILPAGVKTVNQPKPLGTGHAVQMARSLLGRAKGEVLVLCGDAPLVRPLTLRRLVREHRRRRAHATILTACVDQPYGYGRIIREAGRPQWVERIVEEKD
ncbi:NTP transferase domain-containing protein, partial [candidate division FCPU426 bacterium]|nr:NTP transferase domain-containing protein [candidate division FCPU426 bacterium]